MGSLRATDESEEGPPAVPSRAAVARPSLHPITFRAVAVGLACVALLAFVNPYVTFIWRVWSVGSGSLLSGAVAMLFLLVAANGLLARWRPGLALTRAELLVVYGMMIVTAGLAMQGGIPYILSSTTYPHYMASEGNDWENLILPNIPSWLQASDIRAADFFWEGMPAGGSIPWPAWGKPLLAWGSFTFAMIGACFFLGALFAKDWIQRQRLTFPLVEVPLAMTGPEDRPRLGRTIFASRVFWIGFALPATIFVLQWLQLIYPDTPAVDPASLPVGRRFIGAGLPWSALSDFSFPIVFPVIGVACLVPGEVSLSLWAFCLLYWVQLLGWGMVGIDPEGGGAINLSSRRFIGFEEAGGYLALAAITLYQSRGALRMALRGLLGRSRAEPDPAAPTAGHWALLGFLLTNAFMGWWLLRAGLSWWLYVALMVSFYALLIGGSRLVAAAGVMFVDIGIFPRGQILGLIGAGPFSPQSLTILSYFSVIHTYDPMNLAMPQVMNGFKLLQVGRLRGRWWPWAAGLAVAVMLAVGLAALLAVVSRHVGANSSWLTGYPDWAFTELDATLREPEKPDNLLRAAVVIGAAAMLLLTWLSTTFVWWPLSPIGFVMASSWNMNHIMLGGVFIGWLLSTLLRRYGGLRLYRQAQPAFLGLILGDFVTRAFLAVLSALFGVHAAHSYGW